MSADQAVTVRTDRGVRHAELGRPRRGNPIDDTLLVGLTDALDAAERDPDCRVLVVSATGPDFCVGTDLSGGAPNVLPSVVGELPYWRLLERLGNSPVITVALVDGAATAGGVGLACACDLVLAGPNASFRLTEALVGLVPAMALPFVVRRIGQQRAFVATLLAEEFDAAAAVTAGLADLGPAPASTLLRQTLVALRRLDRATAAALLGWRGRLRRSDPELGVDASQLLVDRLTDPAVRARLERLATAGVMP
jgi:polyketide biosynthesis enoyl-CoA hydratase PksH